MKWNVIMKHFTGKNEKERDKRMSTARANTFLQSLHVFEFCTSVFISKFEIILRNASI